MNPSGNLKRSISEIDPFVYQPSAPKRERETHAESAHDDLGNAWDIHCDEDVLMAMENRPFDHISLLQSIVTFSEGKLDPKYERIPNAIAILEENPQLKPQLEAAWKDKSFRKIRDLSILQKRNAPQWEAVQRLDIISSLDRAYNTPFLGDSAVNFLKFLRSTDEKVRNDKIRVYGKALPIVQSSGTGKSRMLTEVGKIAFTLPICIRSPDAPGFPLSDEGVFEYFRDLPKNNDLSLTAHIGVACFLAASHEQMLALLKRKYEDGLTREALLEYWHNRMERHEERKHRELFFLKVVTRAKHLQEDVIHSTAEDMEKAMKEMTRTKDGTLYKTPSSPQREMDNTTSFPIDRIARRVYQCHAMKAAEDLVSFLVKIGFKGVPCVMYFDEADSMDLLFWVLLRLLTNQKKSTAMWYVFMATKASFSYFNPLVRDRRSLRLRKELMHLLPPYFALGFDQNMIVQSGMRKRVTAGELRSLKHLCNYGRPLWRAIFLHEEPAVLELAMLKLTNADVFDGREKQHVLAVLSQRLCIDPVMANSEAIELADRSVSCHMRLLTGISIDSRLFYTYSPSEPILVLGAFHILYSNGQHWAQVLDTFSQDLCSAGLVEKGLLGELAARTLLTIARDFSAPKTNFGCGLDLLQPVLLLNFLDQLFGNEAWCGQNRERFQDAFRDTYVNFTHWIVTKDALPGKPKAQLLANLYARGAALQCSFGQESLDLFIPTYTGSVVDDTIFDPATLSAVVCQVKYRTVGDKRAGDALQPIGIPRDLHQPLPYLALLLELGNSATYQETHTKIQSTVSAPPRDGEFQQLRNDWLAAVNDLEIYRDRQKTQKKKLGKKMIKSKKAAIEEARTAMDSCNRYTVFVRGATPDVYGILNSADIVKAFATFLEVTMPSPTPEDTACQTMRPLESLGDGSPHTAWMVKYVSGELGDDEEKFDVDEEEVEVDEEEVKVNEESSEMIIF